MNLVRELKIQQPVTIKSLGDPIQVNIGKITNGERAGVKTTIPVKSYTNYVFKVVGRVVISKFKDTVSLLVWGNKNKEITPFNFKIGSIKPGKLLLQKTPKTQPYQMVI